MKHTQGKVEWSHRPIANDENEMYATQVYTSEDGQTICTLSWYPTKKEKSFYEGRNVLITRTHREANAELITEAFNTTNECGLTPSQLLKQNRELLEALEKLLFKYEFNLTNGQRKNMHLDEEYHNAKQAINNTKQ